MGQSEQSFAFRLLRRFSDLVYHHPQWFLWPQIVLFGICVWHTISKLEFQMDRNALVGSDKKYHRNYLEFKKEFPGQDDIVAVIESEDKEKNRQFVERLGAKLDQEKVFSEVFYKGDLKMLGKKALLFLDEPTLLELQQTLGDFQPFVVNFTQATNLNSLFSLINRQFWTAAMNTNAAASQDVESMIKALPALQRIIDQGTDSLKRSGTPPSPGITSLFGGSEEAEAGQYVTFAKGRIYLVNARAEKQEDNEKAVEVFRKLVEDTKAEVPGVNVGVTGESVLEVDEMRQSTVDSTIATILSLVICALLFIVSYSQISRPLKATLALVLGLGYTMGYTTLAVGHLNILTVTFLPILIGLAIDFGIHLISRFEEEINNGETPYIAMQRAMVNTGMGIFTGCFTTAGAFFAMGLTDFKGIQEMGIITGGGMFVCLAPMLTFLPALLLRGKQFKTAIRGDETSFRAKIEQWWLKRPKIVVGITAALTLLAMMAIPKVYFDYNLLHMQSEGLPAVEFEHKLIDSAGESVLFAAMVADDAEKAVKLVQIVTNLSTVAKVHSMAGYVTGDQTNRLRIIEEVKRQVAPIKFAPIDREPVVVPDLSRTMWSLNGYLGAAVTELKKQPGTETNLLTSLQSIRKSIDDFRYHLLNEDQRTVPETLGSYQRALFTDLEETFAALRNQDNSAPLGVRDLPDSLRNRFVGITGKHLLQVYPKTDVWERTAQEKFVAELRTVDENVTGTPVQLYEYTSLLKNSYINAAWYALGAIVILVFIHFRSVLLVILSLVPVMLGSVWMLGLMGIFGVPFNPANIMTLPLVIGIGVTNGIHILNRFAEESQPSILGKSTGKAVIVSALTTIAGFGSLIPAKHQGIASLGTVMSWGIGLCMAAALTFLPALLNLMTERGWKLNK